MPEPMSSDSWTGIARRLSSLKGGAGCGIIDRQCNGVCWTRRLSGRGRAAKGALWIS